MIYLIWIRFDKCSGYPSIRQKQGIASYCTGCGDFCHKCEYGTVISNACGIRQCAKASDRIRMKFQSQWSNFDNNGIHFPRDRTNRAEDRENFTALAAKACVATVTNAWVVV